MQFQEFNIFIICIYPRSDRGKRAHTTENTAATGVTDAAKTHAQQTTSGTRSKGFDQGDRNIRIKSQHRDTKTIKMFIAIAVLFVVSFLPAVLMLLDIVNSFSVMYAYFINHFGNPIIYYIIDNQFREQVTKDISKIRSCLIKT